MANTIKVKQTSESAQLIADLKKQLAEANKVAAAHEKTGKKAGQAGREMARLARQGKRVFEQTRTPLERYNLEVDKLNKLYRAGHIDRDTMNRAIERQRGLLQRGASDANAFAKSMFRFIGSITGFGSVVGTITMAVSALRQEHERLKRQEEFTRQKGLDAATAIREAGINFVADPTLRQKDFEKTIRRVAEETRSGVPVVAGALSNALSAKGPLANEFAVEAVRQALRFTPDNLESATVLSGRALDIAGAAGFKDPKKAREIMGLLVNLQQSSRVTNIGKLGAAAVPAIVSLRSRGDTIEQAAELFATTTHLLADEQGRVSRTAVTALGNRLAQFVPGETAKDDFGEFRIPAAQREAFLAAKSTTERIALTRKFPTLHRAFFASNSFEQRAQAPFELLLGGDREAMAKFRAAQRNVAPLGEAQRERFEGKLRALEAGELQGELAARQRSAANVEEGVLSDRALRRRSTVRGILRETGEATGLKIDPEQFLLSIIQERNLRVYFEKFGPEEGAIRWIRDWQGATFGYDLEDLSAGQRQILERQIDVLEDLRDNVTRPSRDKRPAAANLSD